jgi:ribosomal peptide maturation radical SAM protein 1
MYETSRGCWWGQKQHCTFCGLNGEGMAMRAKSPDRVIAELKELLARHPNREVELADNIMPHGYWKTLVPRLPRELPGVRLMYEQKANLTLAQVGALAAAGILEIQPGIESLSTGLLKLMAKGTTCAQNLALLRYAQSHGLEVIWNLLCGFPNDRLELYQETLELLPLLRHLPPPRRQNRIVIDRFSPYFDRPEQYGIRALRPYPPYREWLPQGAPIDRIAYHFEGSFPSESLAHPELMAAIEREIDAWRQGWIAKRPSELLVRESAGRYELIDTRGLPGLPERQILDDAQAVAALVPRRLAAAERRGDAWARTQRVVVERDRRLVPLAVAAPDLLAAFEARFARRELPVIATWRSAP